MAKAQPYNDTRKIPSGSVKPKDGSLYAKKLKRGERPTNSGPVKRGGGPKIKLLVRKAPKK